MVNNKNFIDDITDYTNFINDATDSGKLSEFFGNTLLPTTRNLPLVLTI